MEDHLAKKSFDAFDEADLSIVLTQVARRMVQLRPNTPDVGFWYNTIYKVSKFLNSFPSLNETEKQMLVKSNGNGIINAIRSMRDRTGMRLKPCHDIVKAWVAN